MIFLIDTEKAFDSILIQSLIKLGIELNHKTECVT